ncbi:hypothetical protein [Haloarchaeobius amylolyticus]|uniref:hypothetical protein n=1 Tax=Haloarchaeobius amylolyticus TaxID=1198296 RepID=UPI00226D450E|nr:hypothetical protein [Haloarchaeobius amylolyticus]
MADLSKRQYLKYAGASLAAASFTLGGKLAGSTVPNVAPESTVATATRTGSDAAPAATPESASEPLLGAAVGAALEYERDPNGDIEFYWDGVEFETENNDQDIEFTANEPGVYIDFETDEFGDDLDLELVVDGDVIEFEVRGNYDVDFEAVADGRKFEDDGDIEFHASRIKFEWEPDDHKLEIRGAVYLDWDGDQFDYRGRNVLLEWDASTHNNPAYGQYHGGSGEGEFEARRV